jgi:hypothetical protein
MADWRFRVLAGCARPEVTSPFDSAITVYSYLFNTHFLSNFYRFSYTHFSAGRLWQNEDFDRWGRARPEMTSPIDSLTPT